MKATIILMAAAVYGAGTAATSAESIGSQDRLAIIDVITNIAAGADRHQWERVRSAFADQVTLDYTSLWGGEPSTLSGDDVVAQWAGFLPGFDRTLHLVTNHAIIENEGDRAVAEADFQEAHRIGEAMWVLMGHYRYDLVKVDDTWKVAGLTMDYSHESGDRALVERARKRQ